MKNVEHSIRGGLHSYANMRFSLAAQMWSDLLAIRYNSEKI